MYIKGQLALQPEIARLLELRQTRYGKDRRMVVDYKLIYETKGPRLSVASLDMDRPENRPPPRPESPQPTNAASRIVDEQRGVFKVQGSIPILKGLCNSGGHAMSPSTLKAVASASPPFKVRGWMFGCSGPALFPLSPNRFEIWFFWNYPVIFH